MKPRGFTLVEVLVALAILALSIGTALRATSAAMTNTEGNKDRIMARWVGRNELARLQTALALPPPGKSMGEATQANVGFSWESTIESTPNPNFNKVDIKVRRQNSDQVLASIQGYVVGSR